MNLEVCDENRDLLIYAILFNIQYFNQTYCLNPSIIQYPNGTINNNATNETFILNSFGGDNSRFLAIYLDICHNSTGKRWGPLQWSYLANSCPGKLGLGGCTPLPCLIVNPLPGSIKYYEISKCHRM